jgi:hypothetical protein
MGTEEQLLEMTMEDQQWLWNILCKHRLPSKAGRIGLSFTVLPSFYAKLENCIFTSVRQNITLIC